MTSITTLILTAPDGEATVPWPCAYFVVLEALTDLYMGSPDEYQKHVDYAADVLSRGSLSEWVYSRAQLELGLGVSYE